MWPYVKNKKKPDWIRRYQKEDVITFFLQERQFSSQNVCPDKEKQNNKFSLKHFMYGRYTKPNYEKYKYIQNKNL